jgi:MerR family redox-sensitive transcriptional activator SoxR
MNGMSIGTLSRTVGLAASAIRYYERAGLLPKPARQSGQRRYAAAAVGRLRIIKVAREAGFTISETKTFLSGFSETTPPAARWRSLAQRKLEDLSASMVRIRRMKAVLESSFRCGCPRMEDCERAIVGSGESTTTAAQSK